MSEISRGSILIAAIILALNAILGASFAVAQPAVAGASMKGQVLSLSTGAPIAKAAVTISLDMGRTLSAPNRSFPPNETDEKGRFAFRNLDPGIYIVRAEREGFLRAD